MKLGWLFCRSRGWQPQRFASQHSGRHFYRSRLLLEVLEERQLLTAANGLSSQLAADSSAAALSLIVQYRDGAGSASSLAAYSAGANVGEKWAIAPGMREVQLNAGTDLAAALAAYQNDANVLFAEPDYRVKLNMVPNDPAFDSEQWDLHNTGQTFGIPGADIRAIDAWDVTTGDPSIVVAVIDTGVDYDHPDLYQNIWINQQEIPTSRVQNLTDIDGDGRITFKDLNNPQNQGPSKITDINNDGRIDGSDILAPMQKDASGQDTGDGGWADGIDTDHNGSVDDLDGYDFVNHDHDPMDDFFHGTHVAGTIAAMANNGIGISGVAPNAEVMPLKFLDSSGSGVTSDAIAALNYAVANGATISNNSWGGGGFSQAFQTALTNAANHGHIFVAAAGNDGSNNDGSPFYPANYSGSNLVSVAATDAGDYLAYFSNFGKQSVDLGAPGVGIYSTLPTHETSAMIDEGLVTDYGSLNGTSMAAPHVAGVMALVRSQHPDWDAQQVIQQVLGTVDPVPSLTATTVTGGRLNAAAALGLIPVDSTPPHIVSSDPTGVATGPIDHVRITFSEPINPATFDLSDVVSFDGPDGPVAMLGVTPIQGNREFDVSFNPQATPGNYSLVLGPHIADLAGNELDQNRDGLAGVEGDDNYTATFNVVNSFVFTSANVPIAISGFDPFSSLLTIDQDLLIGDINLKLNLTFPRDGNLAIWLVSPAGTTINLSYRHGGNHANFSDTIFDDEADSTIAEGSAPFAGSFRPDDALSLLDAENARGTWQLFVQNVSLTTRNRGTLKDWSLEIAKGEITGGGGGDQNDPPVAFDDTVTGIQDTPLTIQPEQLLANDTDPNSDHLTIVSVGSPIGGSVVRNADGTIVFTPDLGGLAPGSFEYVISDGHTTASAKVTVELQPALEFHNPRDPNDVNNDGFVAPLDALLVINQLNAYGPMYLVPIRPTGNGTLYFDVDADNYISSNDALSVVNYLNSHPQNKSLNAAQGEGESNGDVAAVLGGGGDSVKKTSGNSATPAMLLASSVATISPESPAEVKTANSHPIGDRALDPAAVDHCLAANELDTALEDLRLL